MAGLADGGVTERRSPRWSGRGGKVEKCGSDVDAIYIYHSEGLTFDMKWVAARSARAHYDDMKLIAAPSKRSIGSTSASSS